MIIFDTSNIDIIQGIIGYGNVLDGATDWRISNTNNGIFNILNSSSTTANLSIIDNGNVGIGITPITTSSKLEIIGDINISGIYKINNRDVLADTSNYVLSTSNILTNYYKLTGGDGINISTTSPPVISSSHWTTSGSIIYTNNNVSVGTNNNYSKLTVSKDITGTVGVTSIPVRIVATSAANIFNNTGTLIGLGTQELSYSKCAIGHCRTNTYDRGAIVFLCNNLANTNTVTMADEAMRIDMNGNVGIGKTNSAFNLEIGAGTGTTGNIGQRYFNISNTSGTGPSYAVTTNNIIALKVDGTIWVTGGFIVSSDIRIKNDIQDIIDDSALQIILAIEPKTFKYIDKVDKGDDIVYGFIAQQIREVIPEAVNIQMSYIPNIMLLANYNNNIITFSLQPNYVIKYNDKIKCYDKNNKEIFVVVEEIINVLTFRIKELDNIYTDASIFVYGSEVEDFHTLDNNYIFTLNVCATQELNRRIEAQNAIIQSHKESINELKAKVSFLLNIN
jgi:hypothetical protein